MLNYLTVNPLCCTINQRFIYISRLLKIL